MEHLLIQREFIVLRPIAFKKYGYDLTDEQVLYKRSLGQAYIYD